MYPGDRGTDVVHVDLVARASGVAMLRVLKGSTDPRNEDPNVYNGAVAHAADPPAVKSTVIFNTFEICFQSVLFSWARSGIDEQDRLEPTPVYMYTTRSLSERLHF